MTNKILNFNKKRQEVIETKRRNFERLMFQNVLGAYTVIDDMGTTYAVTLVDISKSGCLFQVPWTPTLKDKFKEGDELTLKFFFTKQSFVPAVVSVKYTQEYHDKDGQTYIRFGCEFDTSLPSFEPLRNFIDFLYSYAEHSAIDREISQVFFL